VTLKVTKLKMFGKLLPYVYTSPLHRTAHFVADTFTAQGSAI